jgi:hypothetical protein
MAFEAGYGVLLATGTHINNNEFLSWPLIVRVGGLSFIQLAPMVGMVPTKLTILEFVRVNFRLHSS